MKEIIIVEQEVHGTAVTTHTLKFRYTNHYDTFKGFNFPESVIEEVKKNNVAQYVGKDKYDVEHHYTLIARQNIEESI